MKYSNTDCLGSPLTNSSPVAFNASVRNNNCATFDATNNPSYIVLGDDNVLGDVSKVIFRYKGTYNKSNGFFGNIFPKITYGNDFGATDIDTLTLKYEGMRYIFTASVFDSKWHIIEVSIVNSTPELKIDNVIIPYTIVDNSLTILFTTIAARYTVQYQFPNTGSICDFKCYDSNNTLTHWYPMAEGAGSITYDAIGNINGTITSSSLTTFWETKQDIFAYNLINGYGKISESDAKIPLNISSITYAEEHPKLDNGHNLAESTLDFTQGISNIAELNALTGINNYAPATVVSGLYKRTVTAGEKNYLLYKQAQTDTNLQRINNKETFYD